MVSVLRDRKIRYAAAGVSHSIFIDAEGCVYTCGKGKGLLGHGDVRLRTVPTQVAALKVISGEEFVIKLTSSHLEFGAVNH